MKTFEMNRSQQASSGSLPPLAAVAHLVAIAVLCDDLSFPHESYMFSATAMTNGDMVAIGLDLGMTRRQHVKQVCTSMKACGVRRRNSVCYRTVRSSSTTTIALTHRRGGLLVLDRERHTIAFTYFTGDCYLGGYGQAIAKSLAAMDTTPYGQQAHAPSPRLIQCGTYRLKTLLPATIPPASCVFDPTPRRSRGCSPTSRGTPARWTPTFGWRTTPTAWRTRASSTYTL